MTTPLASPVSLEKRSLLIRALAYFASYLALGLVLSSFGPTLPGLAEQTGSTLGQISVIFTANALGYIVGSLAGGRLYDRFPGQPVLFITLLGIAATVFAVPLLPDRWLLVGVLLLTGVGMGVLDVGGNTLIMWLFGRDVGPYMNALHFSFGLGAFLSPLVIDRMVVLTGGIRWAYWLLGLLFVPVAFWMARIPSPERPDSPSTEQEGAASGFGLLILLIAALMFLHVGAELAFGGWIFSYAVALKLGPDTIGRLLNAVYWGALALGRLIAIRLAVHWRPRTMLLVDLIGAAISIGIILALADWQPALWIGTFGFGLAQASFFASMLNFTERRVPISGAVTGYILVGAMTGSMVLPWIVGQLFEPMGPQSLMGVIGIDVVASLLLFGVVVAYARRFGERAEPV